MFFFLGSGDYMSGLNDLDENTPTGKTTPTQSDDELRAIKAKLKEYAIVEHAYDGKHKTPKVRILPANDSNSRRIVVKAAAGIADELYYDDEESLSWIKITSNQSMIDYINNLTVHKTANPIDHADGSVSYLKITAGAIRKKHLDNSTEVTSIAALVNTTNADLLHKHSTAGIEDNAITTPKYLNGSVTNDKIVTMAASKLQTPVIISTGTQVINMNSSWIPPAGIYNISYGVGNLGVVISGLLSGGVWYQTLVMSGWFDGTNMRLTETGTGQALVYWQKFQ